MRCASSSSLFRWALRCLAFSIEGHDDIVVLVARSMGSGREMDDGSSDTEKALLYMYICHQHSFCSSPPWYSSRAARVRVEFVPCRGVGSRSCSRRFHGRPEATSDPGTTVRTRSARCEYEIRTGCVPYLEPMSRWFAPLILRGCFLLV